MNALPNDWLALTVTVFILGMKHGMDPDHLATIDGLARFNLAARPRLARLAGLLFSIGHGLVVCLAAMSVALFSARWQLPGWIDDIGAWTSIALLLALAAVNFKAVWTTPPQAVVASVGIKSKILGRLETARPAAIVGIGALFAISFDTLSQTALFAIAATSLAGGGFAFLLGLVFMAGMMATDGLNGWWVAKLLARADLRARIASRVMGLAVAGLSLAIGLYGLGKILAPSLRAQGEAIERWFAPLIVLVLLASFVAARRLSAGAQTSAPLVPSLRR